MGTLPKLSPLRNLADPDSHIRSKGLIQQHLINLNKSALHHAPDVSGSNLANYSFMINYGNMPRGGAPNYHSDSLQRNPSEIMQKRVAQEDIENIQNSFLQRKSSKGL